jgi:hypothetical protein
MPVFPYQVRHISVPLDKAEDHRSECAEFGEKFCVLWSTAGYLAQSCLVPCLAALFSLLFIFLHRGELPFSVPISGEIAGKLM